MPLRIQVGDPNDPRLALGNAIDLAAARLRETQKECGCCMGWTCVSCAPLVAVHAQMVAEYQALYAPVVLTADNTDWTRSPLASWAYAVAAIRYVVQSTEPEEDEDGDPRPPR